MIHTSTTIKTVVKHEYLPQLSSLNSSCSVGNGSGLVTSRPAAYTTARQTSHIKQGQGAQPTMRHADRLQPSSTQQLILLHTALTLIWPVLRASTRASWSKQAPRATLITMAELFIFSKAA